MINDHRLILHADANAFYASVECLYHPELRDQPVAVCGDPDARHGIVLTKNQLAKRCAIQTGEAIWQAKQKCPNLVVVQPHYALYMRYSKKLRRIYTDYASKVESFGLDECWVDVSAPDRTFDDAKRIADEIRERVRFELGITVSVGVADNKIFAKLGSDLKKPDATTVLPRSCYETRVWPLAVGEMVFVGRQTARRLATANLLTIGDLAHADVSWLQSIFGKNGPTLKQMALGLDTSPVLDSDEAIREKSVGNSCTPPRDMENFEDVRCVFFSLAESVARRLRQGGFRARRITVSVRTSDLIWQSRQCTLPHATNLASEILDAVFGLFEAGFAELYPFRSVGITAGKLESGTSPVQLDLFGDAERRMAQEALAYKIDGLKGRFGNHIIRRGIELSDEVFAQIDPLREDAQPAPATRYVG